MTNTFELGMSVARAKQKLDDVDQQIVGAVSLYVRGTFFANDEVARRVLSNLIGQHDRARQTHIEAVRAWRQLDDSPTPPIGT